MKIGDIRSNLLDLARCHSCGIRDGSLCSGLSGEEFSHINVAVEDISFPVGSSLYRQGDVGQFVYSVRQGLIKLNRIRQNGDQRIMRVLRSGDVVGLEAIVSGRYEYDAIALETVLVCRIPVMVINQLDSSSPLVHRKLLEKWHQTIVEADEWMAELTSGTARARLARLLLKMRNPQKMELSTLFSRDDIGSMLCMTMETASRTINAFQREGMVTPLDSGGRFYQIDSAALEAESIKVD